MDGVNEPDEHGKISNLTDPDAERQTFGRKSQIGQTSEIQNGILFPILVKKWLMVDNTIVSKYQ
ncbi:hypothetical protein Hanom_Chr07g00590271 [Helianthus anomalus]